MKKTVFIAIGFIGLNSITQASTQFLFNSPFVGGVSSNLSNAAGGSGVNGLNWGIIVDINGGGLFTTSFDSVTYSSGATISLTSNSAATDAVLVFATSVTGDNSAFLEGSGGSNPSNVGGIDGITVNYTNGIALGQNFYIVWFDNSGSTAGYLTHAQFILPSDPGGTNTVDTVFFGADPVRAATGLTFTAIPEPSSLMLVAIGSLALLRRRR